MAETSRFIVGLIPTKILYTALTDKDIPEAPLLSDSSLGKAELKSPDNREIPWDTDKRLLINQSHLLSFFKGLRIINCN